MGENCNCTTDECQGHNPQRAPHKKQIKVVNSQGRFSNKRLAKKLGVTRKGLLVLKANRLRDVILKMTGKDPLKGRNIHAIPTKQLSGLIGSLAEDARAASEHYQRRVQLADSLSVTAEAGMGGEE
jgi:hypothetical protein